jgi:murein hydrolase activator
MMNLILRFTGFWSALVVALVSAQSLSHAETPDEAKAKLGTIEQNLQDSIAKQSTIAADIDAALKSQSDISDQLIALAKKLQDQEQAMGKADQRVLELESEAIVIRSDLAAKQDVLSELLAGLQRLQENPPPALVVDPHDVLQALRGAMMFGAVVPDMRAQAEELQGQLQRLADNRTETEAEKKKQNDAMVAVQTSQIELMALQQQKKEFADQAKTLKQLLASLEAEQIALEKQKSAEAKAREDAEKLKIAESQRPAMVFSMSRGKLAYPVQGDILKQFGEDNGLGRPLDGMAVATQVGLNVTSPIDGKVEFAGPFRSYGQLLILNAGEGYWLE